MLGTNTRRLRRWAGWVGLGLLALGVAACAASTQMAAEGSGGGTIADVVVESEMDSTTITLVGLDDPIFTAFAQQDPERVVVDLASVSGDEVMGAIPVADGLVERGAVLIDADRIVRELQEPGQPVFQAMVERWGTRIVAKDKTLDRAAVAAIAFNDDEDSRPSTTSCILRLARRWSVAARRWRGPMPQ